MFTRGGRLGILVEPNKIDDFFNQEAGEKGFHSSVAKSSRTIAMIKIILPLMAAVLGVLLLVWPMLKKDINEFAINLIIPDGDIEKMNVEKTTLYLTDAKGRVSNFVADSVRETEVGSKIYDLLKPEANLPVQNGEWVSIRSPDGFFNQETSQLNLPKKVELFYSKGFNVETRNFWYDFNKSFGYSKQPVVGYGFLGHLNAEGLEISDNGDILTFVGRTSIIIDESCFEKDRD